MNISKSRIKTWENCPALFGYQYVDKRIPDIPPAPITKIGIDVHKIFDDFYDNINILNIPENSLEYFQNSMTILPQYRSIFNLFCKFQSQRWKLTKNKEDFLPVLREKKIINDDESGIVDAIHYDGENYIVLDYKSSASNPSNLRFELAFYKRLIDNSHILDKPIKYISVYGYKNGDFFFEEMNNRSYNVMLKKVENFKNIDFNNLERIKKPGFYCSFCQYILTCQKVK